ncbi:MAG: T9SS type A sorting domain-containing protein [Flavobacterium sp.]|nr:T9SS type A sorting domain-containing protein [Flavobacterium sp.]
MQKNTKKDFFSKLRFTLTFLLLAMYGSAQTISFGTNNTVVYDASTKKYDVTFNGVKVISAATAQAFSDLTFLSTNFTTAVYTSEAFSDNIGSGTKHIFTLSKSTYTLGMQQIFYTYTGKDYLAVQVVLTGVGSNCYKMSPLAGAVVTPDFGSGDTRALNVPYDNDTWARYDASPLATADFTSSEVTSIYNNDSRKSLVIGSIDQSLWKTGINVVGATASSANVSVIVGWTDQAVTRDKRGHGWVGVDQESCASPKVFIGTNNDWRTGLEEYARADAAIQPKYIFDWTKPKPVGWNSWGTNTMQQHVTLAKVMAIVDFFYTDCPGFRTEDNTLYIDIDSFWDNMTDPQLKQFVDYAKSKGLKAGIYWTPFTDWAGPGSDGNGYNRQVEGTPYNYASCWTRVNGKPFAMTNALAMDPTAPGTKARMKYYIDRFKVAGFEMIKLDFLIHGSIEADQFNNWEIHTGMEAYHDGMKYLTGLLNEANMLVDVAIAPNMATGPYAHLRRIACDAYNKIDSSEYTLNSTTYGWWQNQIYDYLDADNVVFGEVYGGVATPGENRARLLSSIVTGYVQNGDDYSLLGPQQAIAKNLLQNKSVMDIARADVHFIPADGNTGTTASNVFSAKYNGVTYVAVFNYGNTSVTNIVDLSRVGLDSGSYTVKELYSGNTGVAQGTLSVQLPAADAAFYSIQKSILGIDDNKENTATSYIFPNPTSASFRIKFNHSINGPVAISIYDNAGKEVKKTTVVAEDMISSEVAVSRLNKGVYVVKVTTSEGVQNFKFVKQ